MRTYHLVGFFMRRLNYGLQLLLLHLKFTFANKEMQIEAEYPLKSKCFMHYIKMKVCDVCYVEYS